MPSLEVQVAELRVRFENEKARLEAEIAELKTEVEGLEERLTYYDRAALKWGSIGIGALSLGALMMMGLDKAKDKIIGWFLP